MTVDIEKLEALAKAAPTGPWYGPDELSHKGMVFDCDLGSLLSYESIESERDVCVAYVAAANPAAVLELIKDLKQNQRMLLSAVCQLGEINTALGADMDSDCDELIGMIADLKSEISGLKTGYEAYERVNAELRAECEALRNNQSFSDAFYEVSGLLGVTGVRPESPLAVFRQEVVPALQTAIRNSRRYEWLRDKAPSLYGTMVGEIHESAYEKDQSIDAAMSKEASQ